MEDNPNYDELDEYRLLLINSSEFSTEPNTSTNNETLNCSTYYNNSEPLSDPSNYDLQNQPESLEFVYDNDLNPCLHFDGTVFTCILCMQNNTNFSYIRETDIAKHLWEIHGQKLFICNVCNEQFHQKFELQRHIKIHVPSKSNKKWECNKCLKKFGSKNLLEEHEYAHAGIRPFTCDICEKGYKSKYSLKNHQKIHEPRIRSYKCEICNNSFLTKQTLKQHQETHKEVKKYFCNLCDNRMFTTENNLKSHMMTHEENRRFFCGSCGKGFSRKAELRDHERIHTGERPYACLSCSMSFTQRSNLQSHIKATHLNLKNKICDICGKGFKRQRLLMYHTNAVHTKERPYKCTECEKDFVYPEHLKKHIINLHQNQKPFQCNICSKIFGSRDNYNAHLFTHVTKKQFECVTCRAGFTRKPVLKKHMDTANHGGPTYIFNRAQMQISSVGNANSTENCWEVIIVSETREMKEITHHNAETIEINGVIYENHEDANQYYSHIQDPNGIYAIVQNPDGISQYVETTENRETTQYDNGNYIAPILIEAFPNEYGNNGIIVPTNIHNNQNNLRQTEIPNVNEVKYVLIEYAPDVPN